MSSTKSQQQLRINAYIRESIVDGPGIRYVIFTQGCPHNCEGCHNPQTHDFAGGYDIDIQRIIDGINEDPMLSGVTFSGGEPFCQAGKLAIIAKAVHEKGLNVMTYSGYTHEELVKMAEEDQEVKELLCETDILVDGPFILKERDLTLMFRGSRNQRFLKLEKDGMNIISEH
ncbi:MAG: anaerobic ribonucleoside-triphosphate reductase activating protein [Clostridia bacterium]|nr:anaerobic ribonucleoside-triphosphate reductase activating protein [Clostridia bacterium]